ncbi:TetR/AcrR family transcriptional regulator [Nitriliruptor alkaliphilus]|uniref:TetR/AcrR family transcriptional regulator n=1 Tax=Nitriliruptor alkaliphilus TaxID=427918 RepID=UPI0006980DE9|nr:TetR/AcrR family transcriptional regulator [Nitriliruptor alkaliphilus]
MADTGSRSASTVAAGADRSASRREKLIRSAYRVIVARGLQRVSIEDVAEEAGVSRGLIGYHFGNKDNLLLETMRWAFLEMERRIRSTAGEGAAADRLVALLDVLFVAPERNREFFLFYLELTEHAARLRSFEPFVPMVRSIVNRYYEEIIEQGMTEGAFDVTDVTRAAISMRAVIEGTFLQWLQEEDRRSSHAGYRAACERDLLRVLGAEGRAAGAQAGPPSGR